MDPPSHIKPSLLESALEYAAQVGIAEHPSTLTPGFYLQESGIHASFPPTVPQDIESMQTRYDEFSSLFDPFDENDKLDISTEDAQRISAIRQLDKGDACPDWSAMLPRLPRASSSSTELYLVTQKEEERVQTLQSEKDVGELAIRTSQMGNGELAVQQMNKTIGSATGKRKPASNDDLETPAFRSRSRANIVQEEPSCLVDPSAANTNDTALPSNGLPQSDDSGMATISQSMSSTRPISNLGSLTTWMESRGIATSTTTTTSPFFNETARPATYQASLVPPSTSSTLALHLLSPPTITQDHSQAVEELTLYFSSDLLKTHLPLVQSLEMLPKPPQIVYRDYNLDEGAGDVDIVIPPTTGIILTHVQALTQQSLPGDGNTEANPVVGRVSRLASRYECLYVLVAGGQTADRTTVDAIEKFRSFCGSMSNNAMITPLLVPFDKMAEWVIALALEKFDGE